MVDGGGRIGSVVESPGPALHREVAPEMVRGVDGSEPTL